MTAFLIIIALTAGLVCSLAMLPCAMISSQISRSEERAEAERQANVKKQKMVYNREQEDDQP